MEAMRKDLPHPPARVTDAMQDSKGDPRTPTPSMPTVGSMVQVVDASQYLACRAPITSVCVLLLKSTGTMRGVQTSAVRMVRAAVMRAVRRPLGFLGAKTKTNGNLVLLLNRRVETMHGINRLVSEYP
mmetsp:Transcript_9827/g.59808  ORF Transcript_9827/g.59808 Transcript_9827/m.59808 type:complete len:128 (+) Transcript_9827:3152-3535(+)